MNKPWINLLRRRIDRKFKKRKKKKQVINLIQFVVHLVSSCQSLRRYITFNWSTKKGKLVALVRRMSYDYLVWFLISLSHSLFLFCTPALSHFLCNPIFFFFIQQFILSFLYFSFSHTPFLSLFSLFFLFILFPFPLYMFISSSPISLFLPLSPHCLLPCVFLSPHTFTTTFPSVS